MNGIGVIPFFVGILSPAVPNNKHYRFASDVCQRSHLLGVGFLMGYLERRIVVDFTRVDNLTNRSWISSTQVIHRVGKEKWFLS